ncbi:MAG: sensor histidine kinase, partial [Brevundimonas sp.]
MQYILDNPVEGASHVTIPPALIEHAGTAPLVIQAAQAPNGETIIDVAWGSHRSLKGSALRDLVGLDLANAMNVWAKGDVNARRVTGRAFAAPHGQTTHRLRFDLAKGPADSSSWLIVIDVLPSIGSDERIAQLTTALASAEAQLRVLEASRAIAARFSARIADLSHELRTPLNGVLAVAEVLTERPLPAQDMELAKLIRDSGAAMLALLNRTLRDAQEVSENSVGAASIASDDVVHEAFALQPLLDGLSGAWSITAKRKGLAFHAPGPGFAGAVVSGDPVRLYQVLTNLLSNAVKFTNEGQVSFWVERAETGAQPLYKFIVDDTGPGFPADIRANLFSRGVTQADEIATGAGLGLSLSRRFVEAMGGRLRAHDSRTGGA